MLYKTEWIKQKDLFMDRSSTMTYLEVQKVEKADESGREVSGL